MIKVKLKFTINLIMFPLKIDVLMVLEQIILPKALITIREGLITMLHPLGVEVVPHNEALQLE